jgi:hypothetical protein
MAYFGDLTLFANLHRDRIRPLFRLSSLTALQSKTLSVGCRRA